MRYIFTKTILETLKIYIVKYNRVVIHPLSEEQPPYHNVFIV